MTDPFAATPPDALPRLAVFTDFDGTLVEIAETPDSVEVPMALADDLAEAAREFDDAFAVITGRPIADIDRYLAPLVLPVAGEHGSQRRRADGGLEGVDGEIAEAAEEMAEAVMPLLATHPGLLLERKHAAVALHFRQAPELERACLIAMQEAVMADPRFELVAGKMVFEARPRGLSKGTALEAFMREPPFMGRTPIFIGDDQTDEDAFAAAQALGGVGIKLGPGATVARMRIADIASVRALIRGLGEIAARGSGQNGDGQGA